MAGFDPNRVVLVYSRVNISGTNPRHLIGTGYFITNDIVLTACHVLSKGRPTELKVRAPNIKKFINAEPEPVWVNDKVDAALIRVTKPLEGRVEPPLWGETLGKDDDVEWKTVAYPVASTEETSNEIDWFSSGLEGTWHPLGGRGSGLRKLELGVEYPADDPEKWKGISGAPVFVGDKLIGIIKTVPQDFGGRRLWGSPIEQLLQEPGFQVAITPRWLEPFPQGTWCLILAAEHGSPKMTRNIEAAIKQYKDVPGNLDIEVRSAPVTAALESPGRWLQFVKAICKAPIMIVEVTQWERQPAVMLFLGIRSVVRRGITITVTAEEIKESHLSGLPFNIQEAKLISLAQRSDNRRLSAKKAEAIDQIGDAIKDGLKQLHPGYLDLPAYEAVRCPKPENLEDETSRSDELTALNTILMLCSFHKAYDKYWDYVYEEVRDEAVVKVDQSLKKPISMVDISSPRLVGQTLYERIRWSPACVVDWTHWRPNVFFELGVRLACSDIEPICVIEEREIKEIETLDAFSTSNTKPDRTESSPGQKQQLLDLFEPTPYKLGDKTARPFEKAFERLNRILKKEGDEITSAPLAHDSTYRMITEAYDWRQERLDKLPHEELQAGIEAQIGKDPQSEGSETSILFASNPQIAKQLRNNVQERWIAAWFYFRGRYLPRAFNQAEIVEWEVLSDDHRKKLSEQLKVQIESLDPEHLAQLKSIIENVYQVLSASRNPDHNHIRVEIEALQDVMDEFEL